MRVEGEQGEAEPRPVKQVRYRDVPEDGVEVTSPDWAGLEAENREDLRSSLQWLEERNWDRDGRLDSEPRIEMVRETGTDDTGTGAGQG